MGGFLASEFEDAVSVRDQTAGGHRAKGEERKKTANTKCQQIGEYHPVCLSHCGVMWRGSGWERGAGGVGGEDLSRSSPADRRSRSE